MLLSRLSHVILVVAVLVIGRAQSVNVTASDGTDASDIVRKVIAKGCAKKYTMTCFKMDMIDLVDTLSETKTYQILPGVSVVSDNASEDSTKKKLPESLVRSLASDFPYGEDKQLDDYLVARIGDYLSTHSVSLRLIQPTENQTDTGNDILGTEGRGKGTKGHGGLMAGLMMMKGTLMTIGFGALAALAGKALMTALLSLMLSAILGLKSSHGHHAHKQTTYEIISKPIYSHSHSHSAEIQHEHDHGHGHGAYAYGRNLDYNDGTGQRTSEVEYIQLPARDAEEAPGMEYGNVEYKTITDDDLRNYYNNNNGNSLEYSASRNHELLYRKQKSFPERKRPMFVPLLTTSAPVPAPGGVGTTMTITTLPTPTAPKVATF